MESAVGLLGDFLGAALHLILYTRRVYPPEIFERRRLFDVMVFRSRHVELNDHIALIVQGACELIERNEADALVLSVLGTPRTPDQPGVRVLERFRFELRSRESAQSTTANLRINASADPEVLRGQLRGFLLKLHLLESLLAPLPSDADLSFACELHTAPTRITQPLPASLREQWAETAAPGRALGAPPQANDSDSGGFVVPLKSCVVGGLTVALSVLAAAPPPT
jgi:mitotic spindle assembly checkpoint protein MAD2B